MKKHKLRLSLILAAVLTMAMAVPSQASSSSVEAVGSADPVDIAIDHISSNLADYGVSAADVADLIVTDAYASRHTGVTHVYLRQRHEGLEVVGGNIAVNVQADGTVLHTASRLIDGLAEAASGRATLDADEAVAEGQDALNVAAVEESGNPGKLVYQPTDDGRLRLAWQVDIFDASGVAMWVASIDAETGELLEADDQVDSENLADVASALARPGATATSAFGSRVSALQGPGATDGASYNVYPVPFDSPYDGDRAVMVDPADALSSPFGWHDTDGVAGPEFTVTRGNNAHAYTDTDNDGNPDPGSDPDGGPGLVFDFPLDLADQPDEYADAAVTNLFYWNNIIHDVAYRYGFDEVSGNFQVNNYGNGGLGNDDVRAEAQDGGGINNANFATPVDGNRPRMQMYLWNANSGAGLANRVDIDAPSSAAGTYQATGSNFGPDLDETGFSGGIVVVNDGTALPTEGCNPLVGFPAGAIALADRGSCNFTVKVANAQAAGAVAVIIGNNAPGAPITLGGADPTITISSGMVSLDDANTIKSGLPATGRMYAGPPAHLRDGDLDAGIIVHEYGHGVSNRLTGGPNTNCLGGQQQMGEGWSDFLAVAFTAIPEDEGRTRGVGTYALRQDDRHSQGIRPTPYSTDMNFNPTTYGDIPGLAVPHGVGYAWATTLWDIFWDLSAKHGFNPDVYGAWSTGGNNLAIQLVMDGMKLQGCFPGFVDGRDAIIAADVALTGGDNRCDLWRGFARRGLGESAIQGPSSERNITEAFDVPFDCQANQYRVNLSGANEPDGGDTDGTGGARVLWNQTGEVCFDIRVQNIATPTAAHIHSGAHGVNGPVVVNFDVPANGLKGCVTVDPALLLTIRANPSLYYVNVHNADFPGGAVRAQLD